MFVVGKPAMVIRDALVIADLHIGITRELYESGFSMPSQVKAMADRVHELKDMVKAGQLVILGDIKHKVPSTSWQELREIPEFLSLLDFKRITILKGNHDGQIEKMVEGINNVRVRKSMVIGDYLLSHGHRNAKTKKNVVIGHNHPHVKFRDKLGAIYTEPVWVRGKINGKELIIVPAFNELCGATIVNSDEFLGPIARRIKDAHAYLLDGTDLGLIKDLKIRE
jgi:putative SbcD/Mre11-related phosphoesterase